MASITGTVTSGIKGAWVPIITFTGAIGNACCYNFGTIPQIYSDLMLVMNGFNNTANAAANFDGISPAPGSSPVGGDQVNLSTTGNAAATYIRNSNQNYIVGTGGAAGTQLNGSYIVWEMNEYRDTTKKMSYTLRYGTNNNVNDSGNTVLVGSGTLNGAGGLSSFNISSFDGTKVWTNSSSFTLYGIRKAGQ